MSVATFILSPAYGRDYKWRHHLLEGWANDHDFVLSTPNGSTYINRTSVANIKPEERPTFVQFRYGNMRTTFSIELDKLMNCHRADPVIPL